MLNEWRDICISATFFQDKSTGLGLIECANELIYLEVSEYFSMQSIALLINHKLCSLPYLLNSIPALDG